MENTTKRFDLVMLGEVNLDLIFYGLPASMPMERELLADSFRATLGGSSAIVAHNVSALGSRVAFTTMLGRDRLGEIALDLLKASNVDVSRARFHDTIPSGLTVLLHHDTERHILTYPGTIAELSVADDDLDFLLQGRHLHLASLYLQRGLWPRLPDLLARLKAAGLTISLDTNDDPADHWQQPLHDILPFVDIFMPSEAELLRIAGLADLDQAMDHLATKVLTLVVKRGVLGARVRHQGETRDFPAIPVHPIDTIGAGDSFDAGFLHAFLHSADILLSTQAGNICGALSTQAAGGTEAFRNESQRDLFLRNHGFFDLLSPSTFPTEPAKPSAQHDLFVAMVTAKAVTNLPLCEFEPRSMLRHAETSITQPRFPVIDYHNHLDSMQPREVLRIMDECGIEHLVNITMQTGAAAFAMIDRYHLASPSRFSTIGWMDWTGVNQPDFMAKSVAYMERLVEHGAIGFKLWKDLGLTVRDASGNLLRVDDERLDPLFDKARELGIPVMFHTADPFAFFEPIDRYNERFEELAAHPDWAFTHQPYSKQDLLRQRNSVFARHPDTTFVAAHIGECAEDLAFVTAMLDEYPNVVVDLSARANELGRQPYTARNFFLRFADRIVFGADLLPDPSMYRLYYRFLEQPTNTSIIPPMPRGRAAGRSAACTCPTMFSRRCTATTRSAS